MHMVCYRNTDTSLRRSSDTIIHLSKSADRADARAHGVDRTCGIWTCFPTRVDVEMSRESAQPGDCYYYYYLHVLLLLLLRMTYYYYYVLRITYYVFL